MDWTEIRDRTLVCVACPLAETRTQVVFGDGDPSSPLWFLGEAPGQHEDEQGLPFVGRSGKLLDKLLSKVELERSQVYITNTVKCRPPGNRNPTAAETKTCSVHLDRQLACKNPKVLIPMGNVALKRVMGSWAPRITAARGTFWPSEGPYEVFPIFHPSYLLRNLSEKEGGPLWRTVQDFRVLREKYDELRA